MRVRKTGSLVTAMLLASVPSSAFAQSGAVDSSQSGDVVVPEDDGGLQEITVTARRVSERQQTTPMAVTALGSAMLEQLSTSDTIDLSGRAPNVQVIQTGAGAGAASVFIRGIGNNALGFNLANPVGVYIDDVYMPRLQGSLVDLLDVERVEILRGPQGTLYGRDSTVGAVKYVSRTPDLDEAHFLGKAVIGNFDRRDVLLGASVPIVPGQLAVKVDLSSRSQTGYMIGVDAAGNPDGQRGNGVDRQAGRLSVLWTPGNAWRVNLVADISNDDSGSTIPTRISSPTGGTCAPAVAACVTRWDSPYKSGINTSANPGYAHAWGTSLRTEYDAGPVVLKSITAYRELNSLDVVDQTRLPGAGVLLNDLKLQNQFSQELQIASNTDSRLSWVAGLVYFHEKIDHDANLYLTHNITDTQTADSYAAFASVNYQLFDGFRVEAGGRISKEKRAIDRIVFPIGGTVQTPLIAGATDFSESKATYKLGVDYAVTSSIFVYASHSTGYRPGSFSSTYGSMAPQVLLGNTGSETAENNEIGLKTEWLNRRLRVNVAAFDTKYNDMQTQVTSVPFNVTATDFRFKGVEVEIEARPTRGLSLFASGGYLDADTLSGSNKGKRPRLTPELQFSVGGEYRYTLSSGTELFFNVNNVYTSDYTTDPSNVSSASQKAYSLLGANIGAELDGGKYRVAVGGKNLTDAVYFNGTSLNVSQYYGAPRTVYLELQVKM